ncbi:UNVERIFIED_CONTAM: hypothetical protein FKN15_029661 [Acipenser sinensis]
MRADSELVSYWFPDSPGLCSSRRSEQLPAECGDGPHPEDRGGDSETCRGVRSWRGCDTTE